MNPETNAILDQLVPALQRAQHVVVLTGAGISAESGLPTFRDPMTGLWAKYRPEELGTPVISNLEVPNRATPPLYYKDRA